jgi:hypothetical protein
MAHKIARIFIRVDLDENEAPTAVSVGRYRIEDDANPGALLSLGKDVAQDVGAVDAAEIAALVSACRSHAGL